MNIFILRDGVETGPFTWVEVFIMLRKGDIALDAVARLEGEETQKSLEEWDLWREGDEVGPLTWDEISIMLREGVLDVGVQARLDGEPQLSRLEEVIGRSEEVRAFQEQNQPDSRSQILAWFTRLVHGPFAAGRFRTGAVAAAIVLILLAGISLLFHFGNGIHTALGVTAPSVSVEATAVDPPPVPAPLQKLTARQTLPTVEPERSVSPPPPPETIAQPPIEQNPSTPIGAASSPISDEKLAAGEPALSPNAPASPPGQQQKSAPIAQSSLPAPKSASTPQVPVATIGDFFSIQSVKLLKKEPKDETGVWSIEKVNGKSNTPIFQPCLEVQVSTNENTRSDKLMAKAYFFDQTNALIASSIKPSKAGTKSKRTHFAMPVLLKKTEPNRVFFEIPENIGKEKWKAVVVFGDEHEAQSACFPTTESDFLLEYPEKQLVYDRSAKRVARKPAIDPLVEHVVKTRNPKMPQITLFLRPPKGITDASDVQGVMAICVLANRLEDMKRELCKEEMTGDYAGLFSFANQNKLAIIAWGSKRLWDPGRNYDELSKEKLKEIDESLDTVSSAWARGVSELGEKYGIPQKNFLLWGNCGSAQWAQRLCLRKPEYFLAIHVHMPGSYDKPTPEAAKVMWCLTIGELEGGYERSKRWVKTVREMGYPLVYKAIPGLRHSGHPDAAALGFEFFSFALQQKEKREALDAEEKSIGRLASQSPATSRPWLAEFREPIYFGDMVNQEIYPAEQADMIPAGFRIPLPTKSISDIWARSK